MHRDMCLKKARWDVCGNRFYEEEGLIYGRTHSVDPNDGEGIAMHRVRTPLPFSGSSSLPQSHCPLLPLCKISQLAFQP